MKPIDILTQEFAAQSFPDTAHAAVCEEFRIVARNYARLEQAIAVLSDLQRGVSVVYYGGVAETLGLATSGTEQTVHSIWEESVFQRIHPDDLSTKHVQELRFYRFLKKVPLHKRSDYYLESYLRMRNALGVYVPVRHRMFYIAASAGGVRLALCLYDLCVEEHADGRILNSRSGQILELNRADCRGLLSIRELEILRMIDAGHPSKEIARVLSISLNTVSRHRQNILEKLQARNSTEACRIARNLDLFQKKPVNIVSVGVDQEDENDA